MNFNEISWFIQFFILLLWTFIETFGSSIKYDDPQCQNIAFKKK